MTSERLNAIRERQAEKRRLAGKLERRIEEKAQSAATERGVARVRFQTRYDTTIEALESALKKQKEVVKDGLACGFLSSNEYDQIVETTPDADHGVRPGEKLASGQTKGMEDKESKARSKRMDNAVFDAMLEYGNRHSSRNGGWPEPASGINDRPGERLVSRDLKLTDEAKERAAKSRSRGRGGPG